MPASATPAPTKIGVILFPGFQLLDICGPLDVLNILSSTKILHLSILASTLNPVSTKHGLSGNAGSNFGESIVPTHTFANAPDDLEVLILPGGFGARKEENIEGVVEFVEAYYPKLRWCLTVCTGSAILAKTGVLDGRRATSNKRAFAWVREQNPAVQWVPKARWVVDGNIWTSSGISAGIDLIYAWIAEVWGEETASFVADCSEYERNTDPGNDRFAERWGVL
ncbi:class I glutamine amidotransferase-like protein [Trematosphaeria pertusa]|uniref:Class I glutamine amidotransferase-like protein n=1 Tax=Trematosphaeria pertusa TaxID=390896 RepID=A0A6A6IN96_9PLEO|nr:class I glutamine amidotransferase-like protein [Trematosphaeria pertusa]KAF2252044.1 class I glutamine amidotransferase-like protein [Trematosphaeria pertusa]